MPINSGTKSQGKKKEATHPNQNQSRGNKKWNTNNHNISSGGNARDGTYYSVMNNKVNNGFGQQTYLSPLSEDPNLVCHMHDRILFLLGNLSGSKVHVTVCNGTKFEGVFQGATTDGDLGISLTFAREIYEPATLDTDKPKSSLHSVLPSLLIFAKDLMEISAADTDLTTGEITGQEPKNTFKIDTDISGKGEIKARKLQKWDPELSSGGVLESLEEESKSINGATSWDQFSANEKLFGLKTDFDEELYTTRLNRSIPGYEDREKWAIEKANEIQQSATNNPHILEERNMNSAHDNGMDEEDRYGAVVRENKESVCTASNLLKQNAPNSRHQQGDFANFAPNSPLHKLTRGDTTTPSYSRYGPAKSKKTDDEKQAPKRIESEVANTFRQFAMLEKDKLQAKRQALHKKEQSDRLAALVKFHKTFELNVPIPPDMVPLLARSKKSTTSSSSDTQHSDKSSPKSSTSDSNRSSTTKTTPSTRSPPVTMTSNKKPDFKFNTKASEFKPNPAAAAFVPGNSKIGAPSEKSRPPSSTDRLMEKDGTNDPVTVDGIFKAPFAKWKKKKPNTVGPIWYCGTQKYEPQFNHHNQYAEDIFHSYPTAAYGYPLYRYHQQYAPGMPSIPFQQQNLTSMNTQFVPNVPVTPPPMHYAAYNPQMINVPSLGHSIPHDYSSPQYSPIPLPNGAPPPQGDQYPGNPSQAGAMPLHYISDMIAPPVMIHQRPTMELTSPGTTYYFPHSMHHLAAQMGSYSQTGSTCEPL